MNRTKKRMDRPKRNFFESKEMESFFKDHLVDCSKSIHVLEEKFAEQDKRKSENK